MPVNVVVPRALRPYSRGSSTLSVDGGCGTVAGVLSAVGAQWPALLDRVITEQGAVREHVNIFVGEESIRLCSGLATPVADGETVMIVAAVSGG